MTSVSAIVAWAYDPIAKAYNLERVQWLVDQRDALVTSQFGGGKATGSLINAGGNGKTAGFQIDLPGPRKLEIISDALEAMGFIPDAALPTKLTYGAFDRVQH